MLFSIMQIDQAKDIRQGEQFELQALQNYLNQHLADFGNITDVRQFPGGYSNLTYLIKTDQREYVLRRPPFGANIKSAHDMGREYRVLKTLEGHYEAIPEAVLYCEDAEVLGAPFYLMERVKGVILRPSNPPKPLPSPELMRKISVATVDNLAKLHSLELEQSGLLQLGKPEGYTQRQVEGWIRRYQKAKTDEVADMDAIAEYLQSELPEQTQVSFLHNDYKYDNLVLDPEQLDRIIAVLDWEMATVGNPLMDLGAALAYWVEPKDSPALQMFNLTALPGNLNRQEVVSRYAERSAHSVDNISYYFVFACYKLGVIVQQIYARYVKGHTQDPRFANLGYVVQACGQQGRKAIELGRIYDLNG
ncbi:MAG: phosphotransferase family protein [Bacteroidota bacterium]